MSEFNQKIPLFLATVEILKGLNIKSIKKLVWFAGRNRTHIQS